MLIGNEWKAWVTSKRLQAMTSNYELMREERKLLGKRWSKAAGGFCHAGAIGPQSEPEIFIQVLC